METESIRLMMSDVVRELLEKAHAAKASAKRSGSDYDRGRHYAYYEVVSLLAQQAEAFGVTQIGLDDVDPERDLLSGG